MTRERKKARTRARLIQSARELFEADGVSATRMDAIAAHADVAAGTLYNYFPSKSALLVAICAEVLEDVMARGAEIVADPPADPHVAITRLLGTYLDIAPQIERGLLREVLAAAFALPPETLRGFIALDQRMMAQVHGLLRGLVARGDVRREVDLVAASTLLYAIVGTSFMAYAGMPEVSLDALRQMLNQQVSLLFDGLAVHR